MPSDRFDLEQQIVKCWGIVDDLKDLDEALFEGLIPSTEDEVSNKLLGLSNAYDLKFHKLWYIFENIVDTDYRKLRMLEEECAALREQLAEKEKGKKK